MSNNRDLSSEWLEANGLGGFSSGTVSGRRTRRYHALLLVAKCPPTERVVMVNGFEAWVQTNHGRYAISSQYYAPDVVHPNGGDYICDFQSEPWPQWNYRLPDETELEFELFAPHEKAALAMRWRLRGNTDQCILTVRPLLSGRDYHSLHHENSAFSFEYRSSGETVTWQPYPDLPVVCSQSNGNYAPAPEWYRKFLYTEERSRGLDDTEDLVSPGTYEWDLFQGDAVWLLSAVGVPGCPPASETAAIDVYQNWRAQEIKRRQAFSTPLHRAADMYLVRRGQGKTIIAGYPWFTDWGRDTFIALRGLCLSTRRLEEAQQILTDWAGLVSEGMLPNVLPDHGPHPEYNSVDASLWYIIAAHDFLKSTADTEQPVPIEVHKRLEQAVDAILTGYTQGTRFGIRVDSDGLLAAGVPGVQLTWMDAKVGDWVVTPRVGKAVEVQSLWINALRIGGSFSSRWNRLAEQAQVSFESRFWNAPQRCLYDVVDVDHQEGNIDDRLRPNQIFVVGGLPFPILRGEQAMAVVESVYKHLWTPLGLRTLAPGLTDYAVRYEGGVWQRDGSYHQGTVWPWLIGPFIEAWLRVYGNSLQIRQEIRERFVAPLLSHLNVAGIGHVSEIVDAEAPHTPRGCPFQAWSLGELLRVQNLIDASELESNASCLEPKVLTHA